MIIFRKIVRTIGNSFTLLKINSRNTSYLFYLPKAILSSIIIVAVINLIDYKFPQKLFSNFKDEFFYY